MKAYSITRAGGRVFLETKPGDLVEYTGDIRDVVLLIQPFRDPVATAAVEEQGIGE